MPVLNSPKHERFAQELAKGLSGAEAYRVAGYAATGNSSAVNANRLLKDAKVAARVAELLAIRDQIAIKATEKAIQVTGIDKAWVMAHLKENAERALQAVQPKDNEGNPTGDYKYEGSVANRALELLGKELGMFIERQEVRTGSLLDNADPATIAELREAMLAAGARRLDS